jgi:hypothetical protein
MRLLQLNCGKCKEFLSLPLPEASIHAPCPKCDAEIQVIAFPALVRESAVGQAGKALLVDDESSCFYHPTKKAEVPCDACGRFLCSLCEIDFYGNHLCPICFEKGSQKGKLERLQNKRVCYDELALFLAIFPVAVIFLYCISPLTALAALFVAIRYWNKPLSIVRKNRWRFVVAILVAGAELLAWGAYALFVAGGAT